MSNDILEMASPAQELVALTWTVSPPLGDHTHLYDGYPYDGHTHQDQDKDPAHQQQLRLPGLGPEPEGAQTI